MGIQSRVTDGASAESSRVGRERVALDPLLVAFGRDMGTLLSAALGHAELLSLPQTQGAAHAQALGYVQSYCERAMELLEAYMDATRAVAGHKTLTLAPVTSVHLVEHAVRGATFHARETGVTLELKELPDVPLFADARILNKLMRSVLRAMFEVTGQGGRVEVYGSLLPHDAEHANATRLCVTFQVTGHDDDQAPLASEVLLGAWRALLELHDGRLHIERSPLRVHVIVPHGATRA